MRVGGVGFFLVNAKRRECVWMGHGAPDLRSVFARVEDELGWNLRQEPTTLDLDVWGVPLKVAAKYERCFDLDVDPWVASPSGTTTEESDPDTEKIDSSDPSEPWTDSP